MTDEEKKEKKQKRSWFEEFLSNILAQLMSEMINYAFDEWLGWRTASINYGVRDLDEIEEWEF